MKKRELEHSRRTFNQPLNTEQLRAKVTKDLQPIKETYDIAFQGLQAAEALLHTIPNEERPIRAMRDLAAAMRDLAGIMVSMRTEGRDTVSYSANSAQSAAPTVGTTPTKPTQLPPAVATNVDTSNDTKLPPAGTPV